MEPGVRTVVGMMREDSQAVDTLLRDVRFGELNRPSGSVIWKIVNPPQPPVIQGSVADGIKGQVKYRIRGCVRRVRALSEKRRRKWSELL
jgi:hypothetical protein